MREGGSMNRTNLQRLRKAAGYATAAEYAAHLGVSSAAYRNWEQDPRCGKLRLKQAWQLADDLGCTIDELVGRSAIRRITAADTAQLEQLSDEDLRAVLGFAAFLAACHGGADPDAAARAARARALEDAAGLVADARARIRDAYDAAGADAGADGHLEDAAFGLEGVARSIAYAGKGA